MFSQFRSTEEDESVTEILIARRKMTSGLKGVEEYLVDGVRQDLSSVMEGKHFDIIDETKDSTSRTNNNVRELTQNLLISESGKHPTPDNKEDTSTTGTSSVNEDLSNNQSTSDNVLDSKTTATDDSVEQKSIGSGIESDIEDNDSGIATNPNAGHAKALDLDFDKNLPETVTLLTTPDGGKVYVVGTAHFSVESQNDVSKVIQAVQPHVVMVELCKSRLNVLQLDEETLLQEVKAIDFQYIRDIIRQNGFRNALVYALLLSMSAHLTKELEMAPGGEFRRALAEAKKVPNCLIHMGDRPVNITIQRALGSLSWWQTIKFAWIFLTSKDPISKEDIERCKHPDLLNKLLGEIANEFPAVGEVFVRERDIYLTHSLQLACLPIHTPNGYIPSRVVGVVGIGHVPGIVKNWGRVLPSDIPPLMSVPPRSLSSKILRFGIKASLVGGVIYIGYKIIPAPTLSILQYITQRPKDFLR